MFNLRLFNLIGTLLVSVLSAVGCSELLKSDYDSTDQSSETLWEPDAKDKIKVTVNARSGKKNGEIPEILRPGMWFRGSDLYQFSRYENDLALTGAVHQYTLNPMAWTNCQANDLPDNLLNEQLINECKAAYLEVLKEWFAPGTVLRTQFDLHKKQNSHISINLVSSWYMPRWLSRYNFRPISDPICKAKTAKRGYFFDTNNDGIKEEFCDTYLITHTDQGFNIGGNTIPRNWSDWRELVRITAEFYYKNLGVENLSFQVGHEPDKDFFGTESEFFEFYSATASEIRLAYPKIKIGGLGLTTFYELKKCDVAGFDPLIAASFCSPEPFYGTGRKCHPQSSDIYLDSSNCEPMLKNFIKFAAVNNLPLDFINWHQWEEGTVVGNDLMRLTRDGKAWLAETGKFKPDEMIFYPGDWNISGYFCNAKGHDRLDTEVRSAFTVAALINMFKNGIRWHSADFDVNNDEVTSAVSEERADSVFAGCWPIFTEPKRSSVIKPVYNAFKAVAMFGGKSDSRVSNLLDIVVTPDDFFTAVASQSSLWGATRVLAANFIPTNGKPLVVKTYQDCLERLDYSREQLKSINQGLRLAVTTNPLPDRMTEDDLTKIVAGADFSNTHGRSEDEIRRDLNSCYPVVAKKLDEQEYFSTVPRPVQLEIKGLKKGAYQLKVHLIDQDHSNSCRANFLSSLTQEGPCGQGGVIDQMVSQAASDGRSAALGAIIRVLEAKGYSNSDITKVSAWVESCEMDVSCSVNILKANYHKLSGFQNRVGTIVPCATCNSNGESLKQEFQDIAEVARKAFQEEFYYDSASSIDRINNMPGVALALVTQEIVRSKNRKIRYDLTMKPNSVVLVELIRVADLEPDAKFQSPLDFIKFSW